MFPLATEMLHRPGRDLFVREAIPVDVDQAKWFLRIFADGKKLDKIAIRELYLSGYKACVYCGILMKPRAMGSSGATLEHFDNNGPLNKKYNVAVCCRGCNSSKGIMTLSVWFKKPYCRKNKINAETVARAVKEYMRLEKLS